MDDGQGRGRKARLAGLDRQRLHAQPDHTGRRAVSLRVLAPRHRGDDRAAAGSRVEHAVDVPDRGRDAAYRAVRLPPTRGKVCAGSMSTTMTSRPSIVLDD